MMLASSFQVRGVTGMERHAATQLVRRAISDSGGWITDFRQFSNFAVVLNLEVATARFAGLYAAIEATGIALVPPFSELPKPAPGQEEMQGALRIEFVHDEPDLLLAVPAVPG